MNSRDGSLSKFSTLCKECIERVGEKGERKEKRKESERRRNYMKLDKGKKEAIKTQIHLCTGSLKSPSPNSCISQCVVA